MKYWRKLQTLAHIEGCDALQVAVRVNIRNRSTVEVESQQHISAQERSDLWGSNLVSNKCCHINFHFLHIQWHLTIQSVISNRAQYVEHARRWLPVGNLRQTLHENSPCQSFGLHQCAPESMPPGLMIRSPLSAAQNLSRCWHALP